MAYHADKTKPGKWITRSCYTCMPNANQYHRLSGRGYGFHEKRGWYLRCSLSMALTENSIINIRPSSCANFTPASGTSRREAPIAAVAFRLCLNNTVK